MEKKLYKNTDRKMISGVIAGFSDYLGIDVTILRIGFVILSLIMEAFPGIILYIILAIVMPDMDEKDRERRTYKKKENTYQSEENAYGQKDYTDVDYKENPKGSSEPDKNYKKSGGAYTPEDRN